MSQQAPPQQIEGARVGYRAAIDLWIQQADHIWDVFNVMLVANGIIIGAIALNITRDHPRTEFTVLLSVFGVVLSLAWLIRMARAYDYLEYYIHSARELEENYLSDPVRTVSRGSDFGDGCRIELQIATRTKTLRMSWLGRLLPGRAVSTIVVFLFVLVYLVLMYISWSPVA